MSVTAAALRELHRLHSQIAEVTARLDRGPRMVKAHEANVEKLRGELAAAQDAVKQTRMLADRKQLDLKSGEDRVDNWRVKLNACSSNKEYQALTEQIAAMEMAHSVLADEILEALERVDQLVAEVKRAEGRLADGQKERDRVAADVAATAATLHAEVDRLTADLTAAEHLLTGDFKPEYRRVVNSKGADALAPVDDGVCTGCGQQITLNMRSDLALSKPVFCRSCGRLLYLPE